MSDLDKIIAELSTDLTEAVEAQTEPVLHPKKPGSGIDAVRKHIAQQFEKIHNHLAEDLLICDVEVPKCKKPEKSLAQRAELLIRDAGRTRTHLPVRRRDIHRCYHIVVPTENAETLIAQATRPHAPKKRKS